MPSKFSNDFAAFLNQYGFILALVIVLIIAITIAVILIRGRNIKNNKSSSSWISALGEKENIIEVTATGSRLSIKVQDKEKINRDALTNLGVSNIVTMSDKVTLVIENKAEKIAEEIKKNLQ